MHISFSGPTSLTPDRILFPDYIVTSAHVRDGLRLHQGSHQFRSHRKCSYSTPPRRCHLLRLNNHIQYLSPVGDAYKKLGLASAPNRIRMCELATRSPSSSIDLDKWEALQEDYQPTALVLDHFSQELNSSLGSHGTESSDRQPVRIALLAGADLLQSMNIPGVWSDESLSHIMSHYPLFIVERFGTDVENAKAPLERWKGNIHVIPQPISNEISSTKIRQLRRQGMSIRYLVPDEVCDFIEERGLYAG